jgi:putative YphP/YqiW family bacilliredoxin
MYPAARTEPVRIQTRAMGLTECTTAEEVETALGKPGTTLVLINSVCGCAANGARPGLALALQASPKKPEHLLSVFAGVDQEAVQAARNHFAEFPPSSPSAALLKDGVVVWFLHRHQIEGQSPQRIAASFQEAFAAHA